MRAVLTLIVLFPTLLPAGDCRVCKTVRHVARQCEDEWEPSGRHENVRGASGTAILQVVLDSGGRAGSVTVDENSGVPDDFLRSVSMHLDTVSFGCPPRGDSRVHRCRVSFRYRRNKTGARIRRNVSDPAFWLRIGLTAALALGLAFLAMAD